MKHVISLVVLFSIMVLTAQAQNPERNIGLGAIIGDPTGVSFAYWTAGGQAISVGAAWHFLNNPSLHLHGDYLFYRFDIIQPDKGDLPLYFGLGGRVRFDKDDKFGVRLPLGIAYHFENEPLEIFLEIVPILELIPGTDLSGNSGIGIRYYF